MFNLLNHFNSTAITHRLIGCCAGAAAMFGTAGVALASPHDPVVIVHASLGGKDERQSTCQTDSAWARAEFERGQCSGREKGYNAGYRNAFNGSRYDNCVTASFCNLSNVFEQGYRAAFPGAYANGFECGTCDRRASEIRVEVRCAPTPPPTVCRPVIVQRPVCVPLPRLIGPCVETRHVVVRGYEPVHRGWHR